MVTFIGHSTVLLQVGGVTILTDPIFAERVGPYKRAVPPGVPLNGLPRLDAIVISHGHWDHLDEYTLKRIDKRVVVVVPKGLEGGPRKWGFGDVRGLALWQTTLVEGVGITAVPARHWGTSCGYLINNGKVVYFAGDTGLFKGMKAIGEKHPIDVALLPIGAYRPHVWFIPGASWAMRQVHMAPEDGPTALDLLGARLVVPIHFGTFKLTGEPLEEPVQRFRRITDNPSLKGKTRLLLPGQTASF